MKKVSLIGVILSILMVLTFAIPVFAADEFTFTPATSTVEWLSNQPEADASSATISITVSNAGTDPITDGKVDATGLVATNGLAVGGDSPSTIQVVDYGQSKTFMWDVSMLPVTADGFVDVTADFYTRWWDGTLSINNVSKSTSNVFGVDSTDPTAIITSSQKAGTATLINTFNDNLSGVRSSIITVDGQPYLGYINGIGMHKVDYTVTDNAGNQTNGTKYVQVCAWFAGNPNGTPHYCSECGRVLQCAWLASQFKQVGYYGWDLTVPGGKMWGVCKCGNGK